MTSQHRQIGIDLINTERFNKLISHYNKETLLYLFTTMEQDHCQLMDCEYGLAISFSGKESVGKALGTGLAGLNWFDIQICPKQDESLSILLTGDARTRSEQLLIKKWYGYWNLLSEHLCVTVVMTEK